MMYNKIILLILAILFSGQFAIAQEEKLSLSQISGLFASDDQTSGNVRIIQDERINQLIQTHIMLNSKIEVMPGYRIQVFFSSEREAKNKAQTLKQQLQRQFPNTGVYLNYNSPFFSIRLGDFRNKTEALIFRNKIIDDYSNSWIVEDMVNAYPEKE